ncbi:MAG: FAD-dependent oxidoreductase [Actinomycetota bacterium]|nr:FAD-dependent oxidoreductase [Actinomycetota bacterium]
MGDFDVIFEPVTIGSVKVKNKIIMPAMHIGMAEGGFLTEQFMGFYEERAAANPGPGLIIIGGCYVEKRGMGAPNFVGLDDDKFIGGLRKFTSVVHASGTLTAAQLYHGGRYCHSQVIGEQAVSASAVPSRFTGETPRALTEEEINQTEENFAAAARRAKEAGFDAVELISSAGYLINQFLSPLTNKRTDRYGGDIHGRMTFLLETIRAVRGAVGEDFPLILRLSGSDFMEGGHTLRESKVVAREAEKAGVNLINVTGGWHEARVPQITMNVPRGAYVYLAEGIKEAVEGIPVACCNRINDPCIAREVLEEGRSDMVSMGRAFIADPLFLRKTYEGRSEDIRKCIACNQGCFDHVFMLKPITCLVNPRVGREKETKLEPAAKRKTVMVAGGGVAGMEASWVAAHRGHRVSLHESSSELGGQVLLASAPPGREEFGELVRYLKRQVGKKSVETKTESTVTIELIEGVKPDVLILATGARQIVPAIPGIDSPEVLYAWDVLAGKAETGEKVLMVGGGAVGVETAMFLAERGKKVRVLEMTDRCASDVGLSTRWTILQDARRLGVEMFTNCTVKAIKKGNIIALVEGEEKEFKGDTVVVAVGSKPRDELEKAIAACSHQPQVIKIGDCSKPRKAMEAMHEGFEAGLKL